MGAFLCVEQCYEANTRPLVLASFFVPTQPQGNPMTDPQYEAEYRHSLLRWHGVQVQQIARLLAEGYGDGDWRFTRIQVVLRFAETRPLPPTPQDDTEPERPKERL